MGLEWTGGDKQKGKQKEKWEKGFINSDEMNSKTEEKKDYDSNKEYIGWKKTWNDNVLKNYWKKNLDWKF